MAHTSWADMKSAKPDTPELRSAVRQAEARAQFGAMVRQAREAAGLSQSALAAAIGMRQPDISGIELGGTDPRLSTLMRLAAVLGRLEVTADGIHVAA